MIVEDGDSTIRYVCSLFVERILVRSLETHEEHVKPYGLLCCWHTLLIRQPQAVKHRCEEHSIERYALSTSQLYNARRSDDNPNARSSRANGIVCHAPFDKTNKEMVKSWNVVVREKEKIVRIYCPSCWNKAKKLLEEFGVPTDEKQAS